MRLSNESSPDSYSAIMVDEGQANEAKAAVEQGLYDICLLYTSQFAGSSSVPAHVEMMGLIGMGNNPMVGATVACAVAAAQANA